MLLIDHILNYQIYGVKKMNNVLNDLISELKKELREVVKREVLAELKSNNTAKVWMNKKETAAYLGISPNTFNKYLYKYPNFPVSNIGGVNRYNASKVDEFIEITDMMR